MTIVKANALADIDGMEVGICFTDRGDYPHTVHPLSPKVKIFDLSTPYWELDTLWKVATGYLRKVYDGHRALSKVIDNFQPDILVTTDLLLEGVHFDLTYVPLKHLGYKSAVVNFSDVYAMNGTPRQITVSLGISSRFTVEHMEELYSGIRLACEIYGVDLVGGDTTSSRQGLVISITCIGEAESDKVVSRSGAKDTDLICVSGDLGAAYMGLQLLEREKVARPDRRILYPISAARNILWSVSSSLRHARTSYASLPRQASCRLL